MPSRGFGIDVVADIVPAAELAQRAQALGYTSLWANDYPNADGLARLAEFAIASSTLCLAVGVLPLSRHNPRSIVQRIDELGLPRDRLWLGIGSGPVEKPLAAVRAAVAELRGLLPDVTIVVAAMGPRMARLAGEVADGVLLNWMTPTGLTAARDEVRAGGNARVFSYVRAALGPDARTRLAREAQRSIGSRPYIVSVNDAPFADVGLTGDGFGPQLDAYDSVLDETIIRPLPATAAGADLFAILDAAAPPQIR